MPIKLALLEKADSPSLQHLSDKAESLDHLVVARNEFNDLRSLAAQHSDLLAKLEAPSLEYLKEKTVGYELVPLDTYSDLKQTFDDPSLDFLKNKSKEKGFDLVAITEYKELLRRAVDPTLDEMADVLRKTGRVILSQDIADKLASKNSGISLKIILG